MFFALSALLKDLLYGQQPQRLCPFVLHLQREDHVFSMCWEKGRRAHPEMLGRNRKKEARMEEAFDDRHTRLCLLPCKEAEIREGRCHYAPRDYRRESEGPRQCQGSEGALPGRPPEASGDVSWGRGGG